MDEMRRIMMETKRKRAQDNRGKIAGANTTGCDLESRVVELTKSVVVVVIVPEDETTVNRHINTSARLRSSVRLGSGVPVYNAKCPSARWKLAEREGGGKVLHTSDRFGPLPLSPPRSHARCGAAETRARGYFDPTTVRIQPTVTDRLVVVSVRQVESLSAVR